MSKTLLLPKKLIVASGAMGMTGMGWIPLQRIYYWMVAMIPVLKSVTYLPNKGNPPWKALRMLWGMESCVNAMALGNKGLLHLLLVILPRLRHDVIVSLHAKSPAEMAMMVRLVRKYHKLHPEWFRHVLAFEINLSCPNVAEAIDFLGILRVARFLPRPVIAKIAADERQIKAVACAARQGYIQAVSAINTVRWERIFGNKPSPLERWLGVKGAVSGSKIQKIARETITTLRSVLPKGFPIIGGGGIMRYRDLYRFRRAGATYFSLGSVLTQHLFLTLFLFLWIRIWGLPDTD
ncbi:MAG: hypothetical protein WC080_02330 [Patescibacteria group bacterium]|jgi:dihydroorotate dehydrogenase